MRASRSVVTIDDSLGGNYLILVNYDYPDVPVDLTVRNTIFSSRGPNAPVFLSQGTRATLDNNLFYAPASDQVLVHGETEYTADAIPDLGTGNLYTDPLFIAPAAPGTTGDYHLTASSEAIDTGAADDAPSTDLDGKNRPLGDGYDIGTYEQ